MITNRGEDIQSIVDVIDTERRKAPHIVLIVIEKHFKQDRATAIAKNTKKFLIKHFSDVQVTVDLNMHRLIVLVIFLYVTGSWAFRILPGILIY